MLLTPQLVEQAAVDIVDFWKDSSLPDKDKVKILEMVKDYYETKDEYLHDQYLARLTERTLNVRNPETDFETANQ